MPRDIDLWPFGPQINEFPGLTVNIFVSRLVIPAAAVFDIHVSGGQSNRQTDKQTDGQTEKNADENYIPATTVGVGN